MMSFSAVWNGAVHEREKVNTCNLGSAFYQSFLHKRLPTISPQHFPTSCSSMLSMLSGDVAVNNDVINAHWIMARVLVHTGFGNHLWIEDHQVGKSAGTNNAAISQLKFLRWKTSHAMYGVFKREDLLVAYIGSKHTRERPI